MYRRKNGLMSNDRARHAVDTCARTGDTFKKHHWLGDNTMVWQLYGLTVVLVLYRVNVPTQPMTILVNGPLCNKVNNGGSCYMNKQIILIIQVYIFLFNKVILQPIWTSVQLTAEINFIPQSDTEHNYMEDSHVYWLQSTLSSLPPWPNPWYI